MRLKLEEGKKTFHYALCVHVHLIICDHVIMYARLEEVQQAQAQGVYLVHEGPPLGAVAPSTQLLDLTGSTSPGVRMGSTRETRAREGSR